MTKTPTLILNEPTYRTHGAYLETLPVKDSGKRIRFESGFNRDVDDGKPRYDLIWRPIIKRLAILMGKGVKKYGEDNWKLASTKKEADRFRASAFRHFFQWLDNESDEDHASALIFNIMAYEYMLDKGIKDDNCKNSKK